MKGLIKKDLFLLKNNWKTLIILVFVYLACGTENDGIESFIVPFMMAMMCMSTFSYDEYNKWDAYAVTLPGKKENIIKAKYVTAIILLFLGVILSFFLSIAMGTIKGNFDTWKTAEMVLAGLSSGLIVVSIMYPLIIKWGLEKGRIAIMLISFSFAALITIVAKVGILNGTLSFLNDYGYTIFPLFTIILFAVSYLISKKIYLKKEF